MDLRTEVQGLLSEDSILDEEQADMLKAAACLLAAAVVNKAKTKAQKRRARRERRRKSVWLRLAVERHRYRMYEKLVKHLRESDTKSFDHALCQNGPRDVQPDSRRTDP